VPLPVLKIPQWLLAAARRSKMAASGILQTTGLSKRPSGEGLPSPHLSTPYGFVLYPARRMNELEAGFDTD
jgi:hypothetical protein